MSRTYQYNITKNIITRQSAIYNLTFSLELGLSR